MTSKPKKAPTKRKYTESIVQAEAVRRLSALGVFVMMIPNGEITQMTARKFMRLVALGFRAGAADTILIEKQTSRAFHIEFKQPGGKQSPNQVAFEELCGRNGWEYACVDSANKAVEVAERWGLIHREVVSYSKIGGNDVK